MKKKILALSLTLTLGLGAAVPAGAASNNDAAWVTAYQERVNALDQEYSGDLTYSLIYVDNDPIPELVADQSGYCMYLFTYAQGRLQTLMDGWGYGAMGNYGYEYLPRSNSIYNRNTDFAGLIVYDSYMRIGQNGQLENCYDQPLTTCFFEDRNGNDLPDEGEDVETPLYFYGDQQITEEAYDRYGTPGEYQLIQGTMTKNEVLEALKAYALAAGGTLPGYYGDQSQCKMTTAQAQTYAAFLSNKNTELENSARDMMEESLDFSDDLMDGHLISRAALIDAGNGVPLLFWAGGFNYDFMEEEIPEFVSDYLDFGVWQLNGNTVRELEFDGGICFYRNHMCVSDGGGGYYNYEVHPYEHGGISNTAASTATADYGSDTGYNVDGVSCTEASFEAWQEKWLPEEPLCGFEFGGGVEGQIIGGIDAATLAGILNTYK